MTIQLEPLLCSVIASLQDGDTALPALMKALRAQGIDFRDGKLTPLADESTDIFGTADDYTFLQFWDDYDKKVERKTCERLFTALCRADRMAVREFVPKYRAAQPDKRFRKDPATFLRQRSWEDEIIDYQAPVVKPADARVQGGSPASPEDAPLPTTDSMGWRINGGITTADRDAFELLKTDLLAAATRHTADTTGLHRMLSGLTLKAVHDTLRCICILLDGSIFNREFAAAYYWDLADFDRLVAARFNGYRWTSKN